MDILNFILISGLIFFGGYLLGRILSEIIKLLDKSDSDLAKKLLKIFKPQ